MLLSSFTFTSDHPLPGGAPGRGRTREAIELAPLKRRTNPRNDFGPLLADPLTNPLFTLPPSRGKATWVGEEQHTLWRWSSWLFSALELP